MSLEHELSSLFARVDARTRELASASGLACPESCGRCCTSPEVETTVAECLPLARALIAAGRLQETLERLRGAPERCVLYEPDPADPARGRCGAYAWRPGLCRMFGFAARRDKHGRAELLRCKVHLERAPEATERAAALVRERGLGARFGEHALEVSALDPRLGSRQVPINAALAEALERTALALALAEQDERAPPEEPRALAPTDAGEIEPPRRPPLKPRRPRRAA